ncbi:hypothetical protein F5Y19DRAFT_482616 [Xylariaceae sp. FL1651]|nr:hypothetical protein F5Y19DRAFT_482616 [Xylariaceae sp. FL1651]
MIPTVMSRPRNAINPVVGVSIKNLSSKITDVDDIFETDKCLDSYVLRPKWSDITTMYHQARRLTWLACFTVNTQEAMFLGFLPPFSSRLYLKYSRQAMGEMRYHLSPGSQPKFAIYETVCNYSLMLEEIDSASAQLYLAETFDGSIDTIWLTYSAEWNTDVDILHQFAKLNLSATALVAQKSMPICYPRHYFKAIFFAEVFMFRTFFMKPSINQVRRDVAIEGLIDVYNIYNPFPHHRDMTGGAEFIELLIRKAREEEFSPTLFHPSSLVAIDRLEKNIQEQHAPDSVVGCPSPVALGTMIHNTPATACGLPPQVQGGFDWTELDLCYPTYNNFDFDTEEQIICLLLGIPALAYLIIPQRSSNRFPQPTEIRRPNLDPAAHKRSAEENESDGPQYAHPEKINPEEFKSAVRATA